MGEEVTRICETCSADINGKFSRFCDPCRAKRRAKPKKYVCTERIDAAIREIYLSSPDAKSRPGIASLASRLKWPVWALRVRARELGLARAKDAPWSQPELAVLERYAWMTPPNIRPKLKAAGFVRTSTAIHLKLRRMRFKQGLSYYTANGLASAFGVDSHVVLRWITNDQLYARRKGEEARPQIADVWMIHENDVCRFIRSNPTAFDLRKVDQVWFMDLILSVKVTTPALQVAG